ncbi:hypothetical protein ACJX0J_021893, partial [Zea mays]
FGEDLDDLPSSIYVNLAFMLVTLFRLLLACLCRLGTPFAGSLVARWLLVLGDFFVLVRVGKLCFELSKQELLDGVTSTIVPHYMTQMMIK